MAHVILNPSHDLAASAGVIDHYRDGSGRRRELCALRGGGDSTLVIDRDAATLEDQRLLAHLAADEPPENAALVCRRYLEHPIPPRCRALRPEDRRLAPPAGGKPEQIRRVEEDSRVLGRDGTAFRLGIVDGEHSASQLRWRRQASGTLGLEQVSLRQVVGCTESYEARSLTESALRCSSDSPQVLRTRLRWELERLAESPIVLNRGLREAVLHAMCTHGTSMSDIARRCGVVKRNRHGQLSGETSWVARRIGVMAEGGCERPTPWVHIDVLALIAREGLNVSPREVELG